MLSSSLFPFELCSFDDSAFAENDLFVILDLKPKERLRARFARSSSSLHP